MALAQPPAGDVDFTYNALGQRMQKQTPAEVRRFLYDLQHLHQERDDAEDPLREYQFSENGYGDLVSEYDFGDDETYGHAYDAQWSTEALLDESQSQAAQYKYRAFGLIESKSGAQSTSLNFVGKQGYYRDDELDLYLLGAANADGGGRQYDPETARFLSEDPVQDDLNEYRYARNNPINVIDPSGQAPPPSPFDEDLIVDLSQQPTLLEFVADSLLRISLEVAPEDFCPVGASPKDTLILDFVTGSASPLPTPSVEPTDPLESLRVRICKIELPEPPSAEMPWTLEQKSECLKGAIIAKPKQIYETVAGLVEVIDAVRRDPCCVLSAIWQQLKEFVTRAFQLKLGALEALDVILPDTAEFLRNDLKLRGTDPKRWCELLVLAYLELVFTFVTLGSALLVNGTIKVIRKLASIAKTVGRALAKSIDLETWGKIARRLRRVELGNSPQVIKGVKQVKGIKVEKGDGFWVITSDKNGRKVLVTQDGSVCAWSSPGECFNLFDEDRVASELRRLGFDLPGDATKLSLFELLPPGWTVERYLCWLDELPTRDAPTTRQGQYQRKYVGRVERQVSGSGEKFFTDGVDAATILEAKLVSKPERSPFIKDTDIPEEIRTKIVDEVDDEFRRMAAIISDSNNPLESVRVIINDANAKQFFESLLTKHSLKGEVVIRPE